MLRPPFLQSGADIVVLFLRGAQLVLRYSVTTALNFNEWMSCNLPTCSETGKENVGRAKCNLGSKSICTVRVLF
jgi:hypothetical protein